VVDDEVAALQGASRWAPRNYFDPKKGREQAAVEKVGVAIGDQPVHFLWPDLTLDPDELQLLTGLASDLTYLGTSRSLAVATIHTDPPGTGPGWYPVHSENRSAGTVGVRVPDSSTIQAFDDRHLLFRSSGLKVQSSTLVPMPPLGYVASYAYGAARTPDAAMQGAGDVPVDPKWWDEMIVVPIDGERSETIPKSAASYLLARAVRVALLGAYESEGRPGDAPPILRSRGADPHCAIVPLANVWHPHSDGRILGIAVILPSEARVPDLPSQRQQVEVGLARLLRDTEAGPQRFIRIPSAGKVWLKPPSATQRWPATLDRARYLKPASSWVTATPVVHSRWPKPKHGGLLAQVARDCRHVGLPAPSEVEALPAAGLPGAAFRPIAGKRVPRQWRDLLTGQINHLRIRFDEPITGPVLLGKARHFGLGLFVPLASGLAPKQGHDDAQL
jgi:CRISPR-associated protein Csb2